MNNQKFRWRVSKSDLGDLPAALRPIRTTEEVAGILGLSETLVRQLENSALRKIVRGMKALEEEAEDEAREDNRRTESE